jgi:DNA polymerase-1
MAPPLITTTGIPTGMIKLASRMIVGSVRHYQPTHILIVFDHHGPNFRNKLWEGYKTKRELDPLMEIQFPLLVEWLTASGYRVVIKPGVEGDDVIGSAVEKFKVKTLIATGDKDMAQLLVKKRVAIANTKQKMDGTEILTHGSVTKKYGVTPEQIVEWLMLMGDVSDGVPGVKGVGRKTAGRLLNDHGSIASLLKAVDTLTPALATNLKVHRPMFQLTRKLVTIRKKVSLGVSLKDLVVQPDKKRLDLINAKLEFRTLHKGAIL